MKRILTATVALIALATPVMAQGTIKAGENKQPFEAVLRHKDGKRVDDSGKPDSKSDLHFRNCSEARAAGYSRMRVGEPGYARHLDRDNDGIACE